MQRDQSRVDNILKGITPEIWNFTIGGYLVAQKWLKDRRGRRLANSDLKHYQQVIAAISETLNISSQIDELVPALTIDLSLKKVESAHQRPVPTSQSI